jgi:N-formylglutamate amidohydrolase
MTTHDAFSPFFERSPELPSPVIVEVPHAGVLVPPDVLAETTVSARSIGRDADLFVDQLFADAPERGATLLGARLSRYVVDLNRGEADVDGDAVRGMSNAVPAPRGVIWRLSSDRERVLEGPLSRARFDARLTQYYRPYHARLEALIAEAKARHGFAFVLAAHSMPSVGRSGHTDDRQSRADIVPGTRGRTSASATYIDLVDAFFRDRGFRVRHDVPYSGGFTTQHYGRPSSHVHVVQLELSRRLYMDEQTLTPLPVAFAELRAQCAELVRELCAMRP